MQGAARASSSSAYTVADTQLTTVAAGQTVATTGTIRNDITLGAGALLTQPIGGSTNIFGAISGPILGYGTIQVAADATLYAAGPIGTSVAITFAGSSGTLQLASLYLTQMAAGIGGFAPGDVIDLVSAVVTDSYLSPAGAGETLTLDDEGAVVAMLTLSDTAAAGHSVFTIPDPIDGTRVIIGPAIPAISEAIPAGSLTGTICFWSGGTGGSWASAQNWHTAQGDAVLAAPGQHDAASVGGSESSLLVIAGNADAASLTTEGLVALAGQFGLGTLIVGTNQLDGLLLTAGCEIMTASATLAEGILQVTTTGASLTVAGATDVQSGTLWVAGGGLVQTGGLLLEGGAVRLGSAGAIELGAGGNAVSGLLTVAPAGILAGYGRLYAPMVNDGTLEAAGGTLGLFGALSGAGQTLIGIGGELYAPDGVAATQRITFAATASTLELFGSASSCAAAVSGFGLGDVIDIASDTVSQAVWNPGVTGIVGTLDLGQSGTLDIGVALDLSAGSFEFQFAADGLGGTAVTLVPCFCAGTRLEGPCGGVPVEALRVGDRLLNCYGAARRINWIGVVHYSKANLIQDPQLRPVRIRRRTFAGRLPTADLCLSPQHAVAMSTPVGRQLVPAVALVDGKSIDREIPDHGVTYYHVELEQHDLLIGHGLLLESFLDGGPERRSVFQAASGKPGDSGRALAPRLEHGMLLENLRLRLGLTPSHPSPGTLSNWEGRIDGVRKHGPRHVVEGWALRPEQDGVPMQLSILLDGVRQIETIANLWRPDLDHAGMAGGRCGFRATLPLIWELHAKTVILEIRPA